MTAPASGSRNLWLWAVLPLVLLAVLLTAIVALDPARRLASGAPPVETLVFQRVTLAEDGIRATVVNDGPDPVAIAQVQVDEAYWTFDQDPPGPLAHLAQATLHIPYPWVAGEAHAVRLVSRTGVTFDHEIAVAIETPTPSARFFGLFALIGLYVGVIPVCLGLLWYPMIGRLGRGALDFVLALTVGLLVFLFIDTHDKRAGTIVWMRYGGVCHHGKIVRAGTPDAMGNSDGND